MSLSLELARHCLRTVPHAALKRAQWHLLDWIACAGIGAAQPEAQVFLHGFRLPSNPSEQPSCEAGDPWPELLFEAATGNILEMDDIHKQALIHPGPVVIPAALFLARRLDLPATALLEAIVRGYEAMACLGRAVGPGHYRYWHNTATCGPIGAAAAACSLLGLSERQWQDAFGHAMTQAAGLWQTRLEPSQSKPWHNARAAQTGIQAAGLAQAGAQSAAHILEGEKGFFAAMCPDGDPALVVPATDDGEWQLFSTSFKPWPACRHAHAAIDCALELRACLRQRFPDQSPAECAERIKALHVSSYADALAFCDRVQPATPHEARFSLQHAVAASLLYGRPTLKSFGSDAIDDGLLQKLRTRVRVSSAARWNKNYPGHFGAGVELRLNEGSLLKVEVADAWGDPENPMPDSAVAEKAHMLLIAAGCPEAESDDLIRLCQTLHLPLRRAREIPSIRALISPPAFEC